MLLDLNKIHAPRERYEKVYAPGAFSADDAFRVVDPVSLAFDILKDKRHFQLAGTVTTMLELPCSRCLEPFTMPVAGSFDLRYVPRSENAGEGEREVGEDDLTTAFYDDDQIDLSELIAEQLHLALPMKPLCSETCKGLCPHCGANLNTETCDCSEKWEDPRLAALKDLAQQVKSKN